MNENRVSSWASIPALAAVLLALQHATVCAAPNWETVTKSDQGVFAIDASSITREGAVRKFTTMLDYRQTQTTAEGKAYLSTLSQVQLDCAQRVARIVNLSYLSGKAGSGSLVYRETIIRDWMPIVPTSPIEQLAKKVC